MRVVTEVASAVTEVVQRTFHCSYHPTAHYILGEPVRPSVLGHMVLAGYWPAGFGLTAMAVSRWAGSYST